MIKNQRNLANQSNTAKLPRPKLARMKPKCQHLLFSLSYFVPDKILCAIAGEFPFVVKTYYLPDLFERQTKCFGLQNEFESLDEFIALHSVSTFRFSLPVARFRWIRSI